MNDERITVKEMPKDEALNQFVRKPEKSNLYAKIRSKLAFMLLSLMICTFCISSVIGVVKGTLETYWLILITVLILLVIVVIILVKTAR